jgi:hypothetical protein
MPKVEAIINCTHCSNVELSKKCPPVLPEISQAFESDP